MRDQKALPFETPERATIPATTREHVAAMEASPDGEPEVVWVMYNMSHLLLRTIGRRSGREHKVALPYWLDDGDHPIVVASYAGADRHPAWYWNLADPDANPEVYVRTRRDQYWSAPAVLEGEERERLWAAMTEDRPFYRDYQALTERRIPLIRLAKRRDAEGPPAPPDAATKPRVP